MKLHLPQKYIHIGIHVLVWAALLLLPYFVSNAANGYRIGILPGLFFSLTGLVHAAVFYTNALYLYPRLFNKKLWWAYLPASLVLIVAASRLKYFIAATWFPGVLAEGMAARFILGSTIPVYVASIIYRRLVDRVRREREQKERQAAQLLTELKFLRSQISPHFLFNVLTNMVSLARKKSAQLEPALIMLAELMRYMLYDTQGKKVPLQKEIDYLNSYISLQQLRFGADLPVSVHVDVQGEHEIEPMLLVPFVENAFKHGAEFIDIRLEVRGEEMIFGVTNKFAEETAASKDDSSGIGLANVQSRLQLLYKNRHTLTVDTTGNLFHITLKLTLT